MSYLRTGTKKYLNPCAPRKRFVTQYNAQAASHRIAATDKVLRLPEPCSKCHGWHLSGVQP